MFRRIETQYISEEEKFLREIDQQLSLSESQKREIAKHQRIARLRDDPNAAERKNNLWEDF